MPSPNFIILLTDTQAINLIGTYGHPDLYTPNIDHLAQTGTRFERAYTTCPLCTPARAALFTGIYSHTSGPWTNNLPLGMNILTMGQLFQNAGYQTAYIGKWHLDGHDYFGTGISPPGWDPAYWYDGANYLAELTDQQISLWRRGLNSLDDLIKHNIRPKFTWAHRVSDRAVSFLRNRKEQPFLLVVSYDEPHHPYTCPPEYAEHYQNYSYPIGPGAYDTLVEKPDHQREWAQSTHLPQPDGYFRHPLYFGCNSYVDAEIGRVIDSAHQHSPENTYILFTSDHGDMLGAHGLSGKGPAMYEQITHIPLIISQPEGKPRTESVSTLVSHIDLLPTLLDLADQTIPPILEGQSLVPILNGGEAPDKAVIIEYSRYEIEHDSWGGFQPIRSIIAGTYKLVINLHSTDELYHLENDPDEINNLIKLPSYAEIRNELHDQLLDWMYTKRDPFRGPVWERRPWKQTRQLSWRGKFRPRPADGIAPPVRDYDTGQPTRGEKIEFS